MAKQNEDLFTLGKHSLGMECEASEASMTRDRVEARLAKLSEEFKSLQAGRALRGSFHPQGGLGATRGEALLDPRVAEGQGCY